MGEQSPLVINISSGRAIAQIVVPADKSRIIHFDQSFSRVHVGSGDIAEVVPLSSSSIYVLGKKRGSTNLTLTNGSNGVVAVVDVTVTYDVDGLRQQLAELVPTESIEIRPAGDALVLSGHVSSADHLHTIASIAERYAPAAVTNLLSLSGSQQVLLEVKFAEVQRTALVNLGLNSLNGAAGNNGILSPTATTADGGFNTIGGLLTDSKTYFLRGEINALEQSGMVRTLAEPNVVALSGETATFLAGGEFPIPVAQAVSGGSQSTTVEYKDFGVGLSFTPTVIASDTINLILKSEVSALDPTFKVEANGISVPALKVRRATTTVELRNGQTFAIAGLIQDDFNDTLKGIPGISSIPIIGALLRSTNYQRNQTELVVFITVHLVGPGPASNVAIPTDRVLPPTAGEILGLGHNEETPPPPSGPGPGSMNGTPAPVAVNAPAPVVNVTPAPMVNVTPAPVVNVAPAPAASVAPSTSTKVAELPPPANVVAPPSPSAVETAPPVTRMDAPPPAPEAVTALPPTAIATPTPAPAETPAAPIKAAELPPPAAEAMTSPPPAAPVPSATPVPATAASETVPTKVAELPPPPAAEPVTAPAPDSAPAAVSTPAAAPVVPEPVAKPVAVKPISKKLRVAVAKPARLPARMAATKPAHKPVPVDDLPVTAPVNVQAPDSAPQPDSNGSTVP